MWNGGQLPWGKPYFQDVRQTMLRSDPGYQQARQWWSQKQEQAAADADRVRHLEAELSQQKQQYSKLEEDYGRTVANIDRLERFWSVPRGQADTEPKANAGTPSSELAERARQARPLPDASGPSNDDGGPQRPATAADPGLGEGAAPGDEA